MFSEVKKWKASSLPLQAWEEIEYTCLKIKIRQKRAFLLIFSFPSSLPCNLANNLKGLLCVLIEWDKSLTCSQLILLIYAKEFLHPSWSEWNLIWTFPLRLNRFVDLLVWIYKEHLNFKFKAADRIWTENGLSRKHVTNFTLLWNLVVQYAWWSHCVLNGNVDPEIRILEQALSVGKFPLAFRKIF